MEGWSKIWSAVHCDTMAVETIVGLEGTNRSLPNPSQLDQNARRDTDLKSGTCTWRKETWRNDRVAAHGKPSIYLPSECITRASSCRLL